MVTVKGGSDLEDGIRKGYPDVGLGARDLVEYVWNSLGSCKIGMQIEETLMIAAEIGMAAGCSICR